MPRISLAGTRIRERRMALGLRQAKVAQAAGVSAPYLNLIEHNRRRIGGDLLMRLANVLDTDALSLAQGAEVQVLAALEVASRTHPSLGSDSIADFADRNPEWAAIIAAQQAQVGVLEQTVATLSDRLSHDPFLSESLHEILSTAASIRSTASILAEPGEMDQNWQRRFQSNVFEDSKRLADASQALVGYLGQDADTAQSVQSPSEEVEEILAHQAYHIAALEHDGAVLDDGAITMFQGISPAAQALAKDHVTRYLHDASMLPMNDLLGALEEFGLTPGTLASALNCPIALVLRRLSQLPPGTDWPDMGLVVCDASGSFLFKKPCVGFSTPRVGAACALWPIFRALTQVSLPLHAQIEHSGRPGDQSPLGAGRVFDCYSVATARITSDLNAPPILEAVMLVVPTPDPATSGALPVGTTCRVCPRTDCAARREPSVLTDSFDFASNTSVNVRH